MAINIYIAEDHLEQCQQIVQAIKNYSLFSHWEMKVAGTSATGSGLLNSIDRDNQWNIYFLDINLADDNELGNGFLVAQKIRDFDPLGFIIFVTIRSELSFLTFQYRVQALDFIIKEPMLNIQERVHTCLKTIEKRLNLLQGEQSTLLTTENGKQPFITNDILYITANKGHVLSLYIDQKEHLIYKDTLNDLEGRLGDDFIRCHRSFLVNKQKVTTVSRDFRSLTLSDGTIIPISARRKGQIKTMLQASS